jgi:hypothetical protein
MLGEPSKLGVGAGAGEDLCVTRGDHPPALPLESSGYDRRPAASGARVDDLVNEVNELVG